jgi:hypothetical protein
VCTYSYVCLSGGDDESPQFGASTVRMTDSTSSNPSSDRRHSISPAEGWFHPACRPGLSSAENSTQFRSHASSKKARHRLSRVVALVVSWQPHSYTPSHGLAHLLEMGGHHEVKLTLSLLLIGSWAWGPCPSTSGRTGEQGRETRIARSTLNGLIVTTGLPCRTQDGWKPTRGEPREEPSLS